MIEGINPAVASAPSALGVVAQNAVAASVDSSAPIDTNIRPIRPPFLSSFVALDTELNAAVLQIRDNETGDVLKTIPSDAQIQAYQRSLDSGRAVGYVPITLRDEVIAAAADASQLSESAQDTGASNTQVVTQADVQAQASGDTVAQDVNVAQAQAAADIANTPNVSATSAQTPTGSASSAAVNVLV